MGRFQTEMVLVSFSIHVTPFCLCPYFPLGIFPRFFYVSKQCVKYCGIIGSPPQKAKSFLLVKPTPFLFIACCKQDLCNNQNPIIKENTEDRYKERSVSSRQGRRGSSAGLVTFLTLASGLLGLRLP